MATFTPYDRNTKETITVGFENRTTNQKVVFGNSENVFYGSFFGNFSTNDISAEGGTFKNVDLLGVRMYDLSGNEVDLTKFGEWKDEVNAQVDDLQDGFEDLSSFVGSSVGSMSSDYSNAMEKVSEAVSSVNAINEALPEISSQISSGVLGAVEGQIGSDLSSVSSLMVEYSDGISSFLDGKIGSVSGEIYGNMGEMSSVLDQKILSSGGDLSGEISEISSEMDGKISEVQEKLENDIQEIGRNLSSYSDLCAGQAIEIANGYSDEISSFLNGKMEGISSDLAETIGTVSESLAEKSDVSAVQELVGGISSELGGMIEDISSVLEEKADLVDVEDLVGGISSELGEMIGDVSSIVELKSDVSAVEELVGGISSELGEMIGEVSSIVEVKSDISAVEELVGGISSELGEMIGEVSSVLAEKADVSALEELEESVGNVASTLEGKADVSAVEELVSSVSGDVSDRIEQVKSDVETLSGELKLSSEFLSGFAKDYTDSQISAQTSSIARDVRKISSDLADVSADVRILGRTIERISADQSHYGFHTVDPGDKELLDCHVNKFIGENDAYANVYINNETGDPARRFIGVVKNAERDGRENLSSFTFLTNGEVWEYPLNENYPYRFRFGEQMETSATQNYVLKWTNPAMGPVPTMSLVPLSGTVQVLSAMVYDDLQRGGLAKITDYSISDDAILYGYSEFTEGNLGYLSSCGKTWFENGKMVYVEGAYPVTMFVVDNDPEFATNSISVLEGDDYDAYKILVPDGEDDPVGKIYRENISYSEGSYEISSIVANISGDYDTRTVLSGEGLSGIVREDGPVTTVAFIKDQTKLVVAEPKGYYSSVLRAAAIPGQPQPQGDFGVICCLTPNTRMSPVPTSEISGMYLSVWGYSGDSRSLNGEYELSSKGNNKFEYVSDGKYVFYDLGNYQAVGNIVRIQRFVGDVSIVGYLSVILSSESQTGFDEGVVFECKLREDPDFPIEMDNPYHVYSGQINSTPETQSNARYSLSGVQENQILFRLPEPLPDGNMCEFILDLTTPGGRTDIGFLTHDGEKSQGKIIYNGSVTEGTISVFHERNVLRFQEIYPKGSQDERVFQVFDMNQQDLRDATDEFRRFYDSTFVLSSNCGNLEENHISSANLVITDEDEVLENQKHNRYYLTFSKGTLVLVKMDDVPLT